MNAIAQAAIDAALKVLDGAPDAPLTRAVRLVAADPDVQRMLTTALEHDRQVERRESDWLTRNRR